MLLLFGGYPTYSRSHTNGCLFTAAEEHIRCVFCFAKITKTFSLKGKTHEKTHSAGNGLMNALTLKKNNHAWRQITAKRADNDRFQASGV